MDSAPRHPRLVDVGDRRAGVRGSTHQVAAVLAMGVLPMTPGEQERVAERMTPEALHDGYGNSLDLGEIPPDSLIPWRPEFAKAAFLDRYAALGGSRT